MRIRDAESTDRGSIRRLCRAAFPEGEREVVAKLAVDLLADESTPCVISLVAEAEGTVVGHVAFSPVSDKNDGSLLGYLLAPLAVSPQYQKQGVGSGLIERGMQQLSQMGVEMLLVYGDPAYYGRFGFSEEAAERYLPPYELQYPFGWQGIVLDEREAGTAPVDIACVAPLCDPALW